MIKKIIELSECDYDEEIIKYGFITIFHGGLTMLIILCLGALVNRMIETILYLVCYLFLHTKTGGYHARTFWGCISMTIFCWWLAVFQVFDFLFMNLKALGIIGVAVLILINNNAPILHPNKIRYGNNPSKHDKKQILYRILIIDAFIIFFYTTGRIEWAETLIMCMLEIVISIIIGKEVYTYEKKIAKTVLKLAERSAKKSACANSPWNYYQPKEPKNLKKYIR